MRVDCQRNVAVQEREYGPGHGDTAEGGRRKAHEKRAEKESIHQALSPSDRPVVAFFFVLPNIASFVATDSRAD